MSDDARTTDGAEPPDAGLEAAWSELLRKRAAARVSGERPSGWPDLLVRAAEAPGQFLASVAGVGVVRFTAAADAGEGWVSLELSDVRPGEFLPFADSDRVEVRVEDLRWVTRDGGEP